MAVSNFVYDLVNLEPSDMHRLLEQSLLHLRQEYWIMAYFELVDEFFNLTNEDQLTKAVFGSMQLLDLECLVEVFTSLGFEIPAGTAPEFTFHEQVDLREPDVIIEFGTQLTVMIEAKWDDSTHRSQLVEEYNDLVNNWDSEHIVLLHVTEHRPKPDTVINKTDIPRTNFKWITWRQIADSLMELESGDLADSSHKLILLIYLILDKNGFIPFRGFTIMDDENKLASQLEQAYQVRKTYYQETNALRKKVEKDLPSELEFWRFFRRGVSGRVSGGMKNFPQKNWQQMPRNLWFSYLPRDWTPRHAHTPYAENYVFLDFNSKTGDIVAGYNLTTQPERVSGDLHRKTLSENANLVLEIIRQEEIQAFTATLSMSKNELSVDEARKFFEIIENPSYDESKHGKRFIIGRKWPADELSTRDEMIGLDAGRISSELAETLQTIHDVTYHELRGIFYPTEDNLQK